MPLPVRLAAPVLLLSALSVGALEYNVTAVHQTEYTDNIQQTNANVQEELIHKPGLGLAVSHEGSAVVADISYDARRRIYTNDTFEDEDVLTGAANLSWHVLPDRMTLFAGNTRSEVLVNSQRADTPANRAEVNTSQVGLDVTLPTFGSQTLLLGGVASRDKSIGRNNDVSRKSGTASYVVPLTAARTLTVNAEGSEVDFEFADEQDSTITSATIGFEHAGTSVSYTLSAGYGVVDRHTSNVADADGIVGDATLTWDFTESTNLVLRAGRNFDDQTSDALAGTAGFGQNPNQDTRRNGVFQETEASMEFTTVVGPNQISLTAAVVELDYDTLDVVETQTNLELNVERLISQTITGEFFARRAHIDFYDGVQESEELNVGGRINFERWRNLRLSVSTIYEEVDSDLRQPFWELSFFLDATYVILGGQ